MAEEIEEEKVPAEEESEEVTEAVAPETEEGDTEDKSDEEVV